jgi:DivIVA domain-containing protein
LEDVSVALDRQSIEKKDFPVGRRGYDPDAVDAHLVALADEIAELKRSSRKRSDTLASSASEQVRAIVEAAETSAAEIQREAEFEAREIRQEASTEAQSTREQATDEAREYVGKVSASTDSMLSGLQSMQAELDSLIDTLRGGAGRLSDELASVHSDLLEVRGVVTPRPSFEPEVGYETQPEVLYDTDPEGLYEAEPEVLYEGEPEVSGEAEPEAFSEPEGTADQYGEAPGGAHDTTQYAEGDPPVAEGLAAVDDGAEGDGDVEGARLIALNMALNGTPRDETAQYLDENFTLVDSGGLLDEVYANVEG